MLQGTGDAKHDRPPNLVHKVVLDMLMKKGCAHGRALCTAAADATGQSACAEDLLWVAAQAITITIATATTFVAIATASTHHPHCFCRSTTIATSVAATAAAAAATATTS